ncbi:MAG: hypothetical protein HY537_01330 [Deltaproteobacteria bacterium]|nr:hypothetical protein [Deltaproteobacteria bacterium]
MEETLQCLVECFLNREDPIQKATRASTSVPNTQAKAIPAAIKHQVNQKMMHLSGHGLSEQAIKPSKEGRYD